MTVNRIEFTIDILTTARDEGTSAEAVITRLEEASDSQIPTLFRTHESSDQEQMIIKYLEFNDGRTALAPPNSRIKFCRAVVEES